MTKARVATIYHPRYRLRIVIKELKDKKLFMSAFPVSGPFIQGAKVVKYDFDHAVKNLCDGGGTLIQEIEP